MEYKEKTLDNVEWKYKINLTDIFWDDNKDNICHIIYNEIIRDFDSKNVIGESLYTGNDKAEYRTVYYGKINKIDCLLINYNSYDEDYEVSGDWLLSVLIFKSESDKNNIINHFNKEE